MPPLLVLPVLPLRPVVRLVPPLVLAALLAVPVVLVVLAPPRLAALLLPKRSGSSVDRY
jgi:hypothetical protein